MAETWYRALAKKVLPTTVSAEDAAAVRALDIRDREEADALKKKALKEKRERERLTWSPVETQRRTRSLVAKMED